MVRRLFRPPLVIARPPLVIALLLAASPAARASYPDCPAPNASGATIARWREGAIRVLTRKGPDTTGADVLGAGTAGQAESVAAYIRRCFPDAVPACLSRAYSASELRASPPNQTSNVETEEDHRMRTPPPELLAPPAPGASPTDPPRFRLFQGTYGKSDYRDIEQIAKSRGWPAVRYKARGTGGFDKNTPSMLMIRIPGATRTPPVDYDQFLNISLPADASDHATRTEDVNPVPQSPIPTPADYKGPGADRLPYVFTMITLRRPRGSEPARVYFNRFDRTQGDPTGEYRQDSDPAVLDGCYTCHPNGMREISPLGYGIREEERARGQVLPDAQWKAVEEMNAAMRSGSGNRLVSWGDWVDPQGIRHKLVDPQGMGPVYGPEEPLSKGTRTQAFIEGTPAKPGCARARDEWVVNDSSGRATEIGNVYKLTAQPAIDWKRVRDAMDCAFCHDNRSRGALTGRVSFYELAFKVLVDQAMPYGSHRNFLTPGKTGVSVQDDLNPNERIALVNCLRAEFDEEQKQEPAWLREVACTKNQSVADPHGVGAGVSGHATPTVPATPAVPTASGHDASGALPSGH